jgi:L,D-peptidoglycan transpeptidase YkuD (ErfK/YbiS/YcfS/YnhG family)
MHIIINKKYLTYNNYKVKCSIGKRGIGRKTKEGDLITPKGKYTIKYILYRKDRVKKIQTKIKTIVIRNKRCCREYSRKEEI